MKNAYDESFKGLVNPYAVGDLAVDRIQHHMDYQPQPNKAGFGYKTHNKIERYKPRLVQRVKTDAATTGVINGVGE